MKGRGGDGGREEESEMKGRRKDFRINIISKSARKYAGEAE